MVPDGFGRSQTVFSNGAEHWSENPMRITQNSLHLRAAKRVLSRVTACSGCQAPREVTFDRSCASDRTLYPVARHNEKVTVNCAFFSLVFKIIDERISDGDFCVSILLHSMHGEVTV